MVKLWSFEFNHVQGGLLKEYFDPDKVQQTFLDTLDRLCWTEEIGFEGVFFSEHHFINALSPTPNLLIAALSQRTKTLRMGVMGNVLAFHQPWRLAEELGMLDYLTEGRLEIGIASGVPPEFAFVGIPQADVRPMYEEIADFLDQASQQHLVTFKGKYFDLDGVPIMPRPRPEPRRRRWMTLYSEATARGAAKRNYKICTAYQSVSQARKTVEAYYAQGDELGVALGPDDVGIRRQVLICPTDSEAEELHSVLLEMAQRRMAMTFSTIQDRLDKQAGVSASEGVKQTGVMDAAAPQRSGEKAPNPLAGLVSMTDEFIYGSPKTVADKIIDQCRRLECANFMAYHSSSMDSERLKVMYRDLWPKVVPILASAEITRRESERV